MFRLKGNFSHSFTCPLPSYQRPLENLNFLDTKAVFWIWEGGRGFDKHRSGNQQALHKRTLVKAMPRFPFNRALGKAHLGIIKLEASFLGVPREDKQHRPFWVALSVSSGFVANSEHGFGASSPALSIFPSLRLAIFKSHDQRTPLQTDMESNECRINHLVNRLGMAPVATIFGKNTFCLMVSFKGSHPLETKS